MGGTFDPIHLGHLAMAESARENFSLDKVLFIPSARPPHKADKNITPAIHRLMMTFLATQSNENFQVSQMEILRDGPQRKFSSIANGNTARRTFLHIGHDERA